MDCCILQRRCWASWPLGQLTARRATSSLFMLVCRPPVSVRWSSAFRLKCGLRMPCFGLVFAVLLALVFTHEGAVVLVAAILATLLLRGRRNAPFLRCVGALLIV